MPIVGDSDIERNLEEGTMPNTSLDRFESVLKDLSAQGAISTDPPIDREAIRVAAGRAASDGAAGDKLSAAASKVGDLVAQTTPLTRNAAVRLFDEEVGKVDATKTDEDKAKDAAGAVVDKVTSNLVPALGAELGGAHMLRNGWRIAGALLFTTLLTLGGVLTFVLEGADKDQLPNGFYAYMSAATFFLIVGVLVFVMGYGSVKLGSYAGQGGGGEKPAKS
jgi:hypothetical protein